MYPASYFGLFPAFPQDNRAFVAMSFDTRFDARWRNVVDPAIAAVRVDGQPLQPQRVDMRKVSDSILTEILDGIGRCRVFVADVSPIGELDGRPIRNANVLYEVGLAHATRLPEEVVLLRSDDRELLFDVANIRVHRYDPDGSPDAARRFLTETIVASLREVDLRKNLAVRRAAESLSAGAWGLLLEVFGNDMISPPSVATIAAMVSNVARARSVGELLDVGALRADFVPLTIDDLARLDEITTDEVIRYRLTPFGNALANYAGTQLGAFSAELRATAQRLIAAKQKQAN
jgi:hypothetical protein